MTEFWEILLSIQKASEAAGVKIVTGDTKVVEHGKGDKIYINTTGVGNILPKASISTSRVESGNAVIVSNNIAAHGISIMSIREGLEFESDILSDTRPLYGPIGNLSLIHISEPTRPY